MMYRCERCDYETNSRSGWYNHKKTLKHQKTKQKNKTETNDNCEYHNTEYNNELLLEKLKSADTVNKLLNKTIEQLQEYNNKLQEEKNKTIEQLQEDKDKLQEEKNKTIEQLQEKISNLEEQNKYFIRELQQEKKELKNELENEKKYSKQVINTAGNIVGKSVSAFQYVANNYVNAPKLSQLNDYSNISENKHKLIDNLIFYQKKMLLHEYIGNYIVKNYKKDNPKNQSLWNTDSERLNYIIRQLIYDNNKKNSMIEDLDYDNNGKRLEWVVDKKGNKVGKYIIEPLLSHIQDICTEFLNDDDSKKSISESEIKKKIILADINTSIKNENLLKNINKYISSHFYLNKNILSLK